MFADVVMQGYGRRGISAEGLIQKQIAKAKKNGRKIDYDAAYEEMIADSMEGILADGKALAKLKVLQERDTSLWEAVKNWAKEVAGKIRAIVDAYKDERMDSREGRIIANMKEILPQLEELYAEGLADTRGTADMGETEHTTNNEETDVNKVNYSIRNDIVDVNGVEYDSVVMLDKPIPKRILSDQKTFEKFLVNELFNKKISVLDQNGDVEIIEFAGETERVRKGGKPRLVRGELSRATGDVRKIIIANLEEVAERSVYDPINSNNVNSHGWLDQNGWESRKTYVTDGNTIYEAYLKIGKARDGRNILYALNCDIKEGIAVDKSATSKRAAVIASNASGGSVPQADSGVKMHSDRDPDAVKVNQLLQKQNAELRETVGYLKELVKLQGKVTDGTVYTRGSVEAAARKLIRGANANGDVVQLQRILEKTYRAMGEGSDSMMGLIDEAAQWLVDHKPPEKEQLDGYAQTILSDLRGRSIRLNDSQKAEASYLIGNFTDYRRRFFGTLNITDKAGTSLDQFWQEMSTLYPDVFQPDVSSADMPRALYDAVDSLKGMYEVQTFSPEEMAEAAINEQRMNVWESFTGLVPIKTVADRNKAQVETVKNRYRTNTGAV